MINNINEETTEIKFKVPGLEKKIWASNPNLPTASAKMHMFAREAKTLEEQSQELLDYARQTKDVAYQE